MTDQVQEEQKKPAKVRKSKPETITKEEFNNIKLEFETIIGRFYQEFKTLEDKVDLHHRFLLKNFSRVEVD